MPTLAPRAVLVDLYGTLVEDDDDVVARLCDEVAAHAGEHPGDVADTYLAHLADAGDAAHGAAFRTLAGLTRATLGHLADTYGCPLDVDRWSATFRAAWRAPRAHADAAAFLSGLDVPVCLVSDVDRDDAEAVLARHGLAVDLVVTSEDARAYKPRPQPFRRALERLGVAPHEAVHVGDSPTRDVAGAAALGIPAVLVDREGGGGGRLTGGAALVVPSLAALRWDGG